MLLVPALSHGNGDTKLPVEGKGDLLRMGLLVQKNAVILGEPVELKITITNASPFPVRIWKSYA